MPPVLGVFDSGFGGLTVLRELLPRVPGARYLYLGDTARLPYGSKSRETIVRYAVESARFLESHGAEMLVVACNTATALALAEMRLALSIPVVGVVEPGARAAAAANPHGDVLVLATEATVHSHAYTRACAALGLAATEKACPLLVPLVEEGWTADHKQPAHAPGAHDPESEDPRNPDTSNPDPKSEVTDAVLRIYLGEALAAAPDSRTLLLGCTHYPLLRPAIARALAALGLPLNVIDSAEATAAAVAALLGADPATQAVPADASCEFFATDSVAKFERLGSRFLGRPIHGVRLVDLGG
jgi:glutamate racemase